jgi:hypothetical protein
MYTIVNIRSTLAMTADGETASVWIIVNNTVDYASHKTSNIIQDEQIRHSTVCQLRTFGNYDQQKTCNS